LSAGSAKLALRAKWRSAGQAAQQRAISFWAFAVKKKPWQLVSW
jgi:hypothetical protein